MLPEEVNLFNKISFSGFQLERQVISPMQRERVYWSEKSLNLKPISYPLILMYTKSCHSRIPITYWCCLHSEYFAFLQQLCSTIVQVLEIPLVLYNEQHRLKSFSWQFEILKHVYKIHHLARQDKSCFYLVGAIGSGLEDICSADKKNSLPSHYGQFAGDDKLII